MPMSNELKVTSRHLARNAYLYVRQSTLRQVLENTESTTRQYALRQRAVALGWQPDQILVIDCDQGQSGASAADRAGFQQLVAEVGLGRAGIVLGLEVSRLARSSTDWHRLLEICALSGTLILDEDGVYDPSHFNDRLLLGLKRPGSQSTSDSTFARLGAGQTPVSLGPSFASRADSARRRPWPQPAPAMAATEIADMLARIGESERRPPVQRVQLVRDLRVGVGRR